MHLHASHSLPCLCELAWSHSSEPNRLHMFLLPSKIVSSLPTFTLDDNVECTAWHKEDKSQKTATSLETWTAAGNTGNMHRVKCSRVGRPARSATGQGARTTPEMIGKPQSRYYWHNTSGVPCHAVCRSDWWGHRGLSPAFVVRRGSRSGHQRGK